VIVAGALAASPLLGGGVKESKPTITLRVVNEAHVDDRILGKAKQEAVWMLARAGVKLLWLDCVDGGEDRKKDDPCLAQSAPNDFWLRITSYRPRRTDSNMLGFSDLYGSMENGVAGVYYPRVTEIVEKALANSSEILATAVVHEVGHLILGAQAHHRSGVMMAQWGPKQLQLIDLGMMDFAPDQVKLLQSEVKRRAGSLQLK
jgi:hypothetical protein